MISLKPMSSPGRAENYPPPLMRFLSSSLESKSRGKSRLNSSPMFVRKKNTSIDTQEPSSPKVTCMGQVRIRRSKTGRTPNLVKSRCRWLKNALLCTSLNRKLKQSAFWLQFRKWIMYLHAGFRRKVDNSSETESKFDETNVSTDRKYKKRDGEVADDDEEEAQNLVCCPSSTPPKNALLLTRCRSTPYRSSPLTIRFKGSPKETKQNAESENKNDHDPTLDGELDCGDSATELLKDTESGEFIGLCEGINGSGNEGVATSCTIEKLKTGDTCYVRPLLLTKSKSEPARTGEKLDPEYNFCGRRRFDFRNSFFPQVCD